MIAGLGNSIPSGNSDSEGGTAGTGWCMSSGKEGLIFEATAVSSELIYGTCKAESKNPPDI